MFTSILAKSETIFSLKLTINSFVFPVKPCIAILACFSVLASNKSLMLSDSIKLIRPFKNALLVNSPGSAKTAPFVNNNSKILFVVT